MKKLLLVVLFLPLLVSCANNKSNINNKIANDDSQVKTDKDRGYLCVNTIKVGTHLKKKICTTKAQRDAAKIASEQFKAEMRRQRQNQTGEINKN